jgi:hypothetical protein
VQAVPSQPFVVTIAQEPAEQVTVGDVIIGSLSLAGVLVLLALVLGAVFSLGLVLWNRRHPPEERHLPSVSPLTASPGGPPSSQAR